MVGQAGFEPATYRLGIRFFSKLKDIDANGKCGLNLYLCGFREGCLKLTLVY